MDDRLRFQSLVAVDLREAIAWYDDIAEGLGDRFRDTVSGELDQIAANPEQFAIAAGEFRFAKVGRFPYVILFRSSGDVVQVTGVFHTASDRAKWRKRIEDT